MIVNCSFSRAGLFDGLVGWLVGQKESCLHYQREKQLEGLAADDTRPLTVGLFDRLHVCMVQEYLHLLVNDRQSIQ